MPHPMRRNCDFVILRKPRLDDAATQTAGDAATQAPTTGDEIIKHSYFSPLYCLSCLPPYPGARIDCTHNCLYEEFNLRGIRLDRFQPGFVSCSFTVPPRLTDRNGNLAVGAIASLVDEIGATAIYEKDVPMNVSVDMSISYLSTAKVNDELEISGKLLGIKGGYHGTLVVLKKKATGEIIAEGRHSLFSKPTSKI